MVVYTHLSKCTRCVMGPVEALEKHPSAPFVREIKVVTDGGSFCLVLLAQDAKSLEVESLPQSAVDALEEKER